MVSQESFSNNVKLETAESINKDLSQSKDPVELYNKAIAVLSKMEKNFGKTLGDNPYNYFDGNVLVNSDKTTFEFKARELNEKIQQLKEESGECRNELLSKASITCIASSVLFGQFNRLQLYGESMSLADTLLKIQSIAKRNVGHDLRDDGVLNYRSHTPLQGPSEEEQENLEGKTLTYIIEGGDSLSAIAKNFYGDFRLYKELKKFNGLNSDNITKGESLRLPAKLANKSRLKQSLREDKNVMRKESKAVIELSTNNGDRIRFSKLQDYNPVTTPQRILITDPKLNQLLYNDVATSNLDKTDPSVLKDFVVTFLTNNPNVLSEFGIRDVNHLSPKQAILLSIRIVTMQLTYSNIQAAFDGYDEKGQPKLDQEYWKNVPKKEREKYLKNPALFGQNIAPIDYLSINELFKSKEGVCRNYGQAVKGVFMALQKMQSPKDSRLVNTYCVTSNFQTGTESDRKHIVNDHLWNTFYTVTPSGVKSTVIDATWADNEQGKMKNPDYSAERFVFNLEEMEKSGLLNEEQKIEQLQKWCDDPKNIKAKSYQAVCIKLAEYYLNKDFSKVLNYFLKVPSIELLRDLKAKSKSGNWDREMSAFVLNKENESLPFYKDLCLEYYYSKGDYSSIEKFLKNKPFSKGINWGSEVILVAASVKSGIDFYNQLSIPDLPQQILKNKSWLMKLLPAEIALIERQFGQKKRT